VSGRLTSTDRTQDRYTIRGYLSTAAKHGHNMLTEMPRSSRTGDPLGSFSEKVRARASESTEVLPGVQR